MFVAATQPLSDGERKTVLPRNTTIHDGRGDIYVYKYNAEGRIVASMFPMGRRGVDMDYTRRVVSDRLQWLHPQIRQEIRWDYFWFGELDRAAAQSTALHELRAGPHAALLPCGRLGSVQAGRSPSATARMIVYLEPGPSKIEVRSPYTSPDPECRYPSPAPREKGRRG